MKFKVTQDVDYVSGHLRIGHLEGIVEVDNEDILKQMIESGEIADDLEMVIDDYEVDDYGDVIDTSYKAIEEE